MTNTKSLWKKVSGMNITHNFLLGPINAESLLKDPKHLLFTLSRYKFASKMLVDCKHILEIGCGEGIGTFMFLAETSAKITAIDFDEHQIDYALKNVLPFSKNRVTFLCKDMVSSPYEQKICDGLVCMDVIEHIALSEEEAFLKNSISCLKEKGIAVFGTPNKYAHQYASTRSKEGHINLFDPERLIATLKKYFSHVFLFSMNDEMIHTGFSKMAHYLMVLCIK
jgi:2-polyprenyl-3-methyl-5-hydroxy-6-metoxy-1,4-benzoquinol methylase